MTPKIPEQVPKIIESKKAVVPFKTKERCRSLFYQNKNYPQISKLTGVPEKDLAAMAKAGKWRETRMQLAKEAIEDSEVEFRKFQADNKLPTAQRQVDAGGLIEGKVLEIVENIDPGDKDAGKDLARAAKTMNDVAAVTARAVGLADKREDTSIFDDKAKKQDRIPVIVVGINPTAPAGPEEQPAINVAYVEQEPTLPRETADNDYGDDIEEPSDEP